MIQQLPKIDKNTSQCFDLRAFVRRVILTLLTKALRSKRRDVFLSILSSCYTTLDAKLFEDAGTLPLGYTGIWYTQP